MTDQDSTAERQSITEQQHYVPRFYLKRFADEQDFLSVLDSKEKRLCPRRPYPGVCYDSFFYAMRTGQADDTSQMVEGWLGRIEDYVARGLSRVIDKVHLSQQITEEDKYVLSVLFSMLWLRGPSMRNWINGVQEQMMKGVMRLSAGDMVNAYVDKTGVQWTDKDKGELEEFCRSGEYSLKFGNDLHLRFMVESLGLGGEGFANLFFAQKWTIYVARGQRRFITSDNPIAMWSPPADQWWGNSFLEREHFLALSPDILLELTYPMGSSKAKRVTLFRDQDDIVMMFNMLIAGCSHRYAYGRDSSVFEDMLKGLDHPGRAEALYYKRFVCPHEE